MDAESRRIIEILQRRIDALERALASRDVRTSGLSGPDLVLVKITGDASGGGKYDGKVLTRPVADVPDTGNLSEAELGAIPGSNDALVLNVREVGQSTHDLDDSGFLPLIFIGVRRQVNTDGMQVIAIDGRQSDSGCT